MQHRFKWLATVGIFATLLLGASAAGKGRDRIRILYWNIQNGMWDGQADNYDRFVDWVKAKRPDICVWCEAKSNYRTASAEHFAEGEGYLPEHWGKLAKRYGHKYWYIGGYRDNFPQVITSRYPITSMARIVGAEPDSVVAHGAGWACIDLRGRKLNLVALHTWPQAYSFGISPEERAASKAEHGGDRYRRKEIEYVCTHTILTRPGARNELWMMMGDFNSRSPKDNWIYGYPQGAPELMVHEYILSQTPYLDLLAERDPASFYSSTGKRSRIDYIYCTPPVAAAVQEARIVSDSYTLPVRDPGRLSNFYHPSDHRPILVDLDLGRAPRDSGLQQGEKPVDFGEVRNY